MRKASVYFKLGIILTLIMLLLASCARGPDQKPQPKEEPTITLYVNETGEVKEIKLEEYLAGVVAAEMEPTWPVEALAAQAILARTYTLENIETGRVKEMHGTDASTSVEEFQAYNPDLINDQVRTAIEATRGEVIKYKGQYVKGWFSACCASNTAGAEEGLNWTETKTPYIEAGLDDGCLEITQEENVNWEARIPLAQVRAAVQEIRGNELGDINSAEITETGPSGRAVEITLGETKVNAPELRLAVGSDIMRSTLLKDISLAGDHLVMVGNGYGHGVGMCQWGAKRMAEDNKSPEEIIKFYYRGVTIEKLWD
ncbi:SpoIID/LytB domain-containing protein [Desulfofalx alkaliphila]|uniref:SpoIID/LytB domain-containing protein n=1 Tax=Desulfofalx alkaliphila TaxID=105483 RepID=UPI0004E0D62C|nr:SpoIID/LytB domain-containing protein [Desulfofalx alkaliphila]